MLSPALARRSTAALLLLVAALVWLAHVELPSRVHSDRLDDAWLGALAHFLVSGARAGTDWVFTAGPFAGLASPVWEPELFWWKLVAWEGLWRLATVACLVLAAVRLASRIERALCLAYLLFTTLYLDAWSLATLVAAGVLLADPQVPRRRAVDLVALLAIGGLALAKFTLLVAAGVLIAGVVCARADRQGRAAALELAAAASIVFLLLWFLAGQGPADVAPYLESSRQIASNYSEAQSTPPAEAAWRTLGIACSALLGLQLALWSATGGFSRSKAFVAAALAFVVFCAWKTGFVRAADHPQFFFTFAPVAALLLPRPATPSDWRGTGVRALSLTVFALGCVGIARSDSERAGLAGLVGDWTGAPARIAGTASGLVALGELRSSLEERAEENRRLLQLPDVCARVGRESIDCLGFRAGLLLLHGLDWQPRPAFQGYITFTPELQQRNADFLAGPRAPRFLLSRFESIDGRWPAMDDALALEVASRGYVPLLQEGEYLLLGRSEGPLRPVQREVALERELRLGEPLALPVAAEGSAQVVTLGLRASTAGWIARLLESTPPLTMRLTAADGTTRTGHIVPSMMRSRVLIDPLVETGDDWADWMLGRSLPRCVELVIEAPEGGAWRFDPTFTLRIERARGLQPELREGLELPGWARGALRTSPDRSFTPRPPYQAIVDGRPVAAVGAPSRLLWRLATGRHRVRARYGILPALSARQDTEAAEFLVIDSAEGDSRVLLRRTVTAGAAAERAGMQSFEATFENAQRGVLVLATAPATAPGSAPSDGAAPACYWADVSIEPVADSPR